MQSYSLQINHFAIFVKMMDWALKTYLDIEVSGLVYVYSKCLYHSWRVIHLNVWFDDEWALYVLYIIYHMDIIITL